MPHARVSVFAESNVCWRAAADVAERFGLPLNDTDCDVRLIVGETGRSLHVMHGELSQGLPITCNWSQRDVHSPAGARLTQPLLKAVGIHKGSNEPRPTVIDATAGYGADAHLLASAGCRVTMIERCPAMAALLEAAGAPHLHAELRGSLHVLHGNSLTLLSQLPGADVVYLDPMFAPGRKTLERRPMRVLRLLTGEDPDAAALLSAALRAADKRVVVKRPLRAAPLADLSPKVTHKGQAVRYDVYIPTEMTV